LNGVNGTSASQAFRNVARRINGETVPFLDLMAKDNFMDRLRRWLNGN
jgi:septum site-determining protein MinD